MKKLKATEILTLLQRVDDVSTRQMQKEIQEALVELKELTQKKSCYDCKDYLNGVCVDPRGCYCIWQQGMQDRHTPKE